MSRTLLLSACCLLLAACGRTAEAPTHARVVTEAVAYKDGDTQLEGYLAYDAALAGKRPGILVLHEWWGLTGHPKERARRLAKLGYVAFCADMYGKGKVTDDPKQAAAWAEGFYGDRAGAGRRRLKAGYDVLRDDPRVDPERLGVMGFCYGGSVALEAAWAGLDVKGVVCFHGTLTTPSPEEAKDVKAAVLVCNGGADVWVGPDKVKAFESTLAKTTIKYRVQSYEGAHHAFTNPDADKFGMDNVKYNKAADAQSWAAMKAFWQDALR